MMAISKPFLRIVVCTAAVLAVVAFVSALHLHDLPLSVALNLFLIVVLVASIGWGARYAIYVSFIATLGFSWSLPPAGHFHLSDGRGQGLRCRFRRRIAAGEESDLRCLLHHQAPGDWYGIGDSPHDCRVPWR